MGAGALVPQRVFDQQETGQRGEWGDLSGGGDAQDQLGPGQMDLFRAIKRHLDPQGLMNPGGILGLDPPPETFT